MWLFKDIESDPEIKLVGVKKDFVLIANLGALTIVTHKVSNVLVSLNCSNVSKLFTTIKEWSMDDF